MELGVVPASVSGVMSQPAGRVDSYGGVSYGGVLDEARAAETRRARPAATAGRAAEQLRRGGRRR